MDVNQFLNTIYRYVQLGVHIKAFYSKEYGKFHRELDEVVEFYVDEETNQPKSRTIYKKPFGKPALTRKPSDHLIQYIENQNVDISDIIAKMPDDDNFNEENEEMNLEEAAEQAKQENEEREKQIQEHSSNIDQKEEKKEEPKAEEKPAEEKPVEEKTEEVKEEKPQEIPTVIKQDKPEEKKAQIVQLQTTQTQIAQPDVVPVQTNAQPVAQPAAPAAPATPVAAPAAQPAAQPQQPGVTPQVVAAASINKLSE